MYCSQLWRLGVSDQSTSRVGWGPSSGLQTSCCILTCLAGTRELCGVTFIKARISSRSLLPKAPSPNTIPLGIRILTYGFKGRHKLSDHSILHAEQSPIACYGVQSVPLTEEMRVSFQTRVAACYRGLLEREFVEINSPPVDAWQ